MFSLPSLPPTHTSFFLGGVKILSILNMLTSRHLIFLRFLRLRNDLLMCGSSIVIGRHLILFIRSHLSGDMSKFHSALGYLGFHGDPVTAWLGICACGCQSPSQPAAASPLAWRSVCIRTLCKVPVRFWQSFPNRNSPKMKTGCFLTLPVSAGHPGVWLSHIVSYRLRAAWGLNKWTIYNYFLLLQTSLPSFQLDCFIYALDL